MAGTTLRDLLADKGHHVFIIDPDATVRDCALALTQHRAGSLVVQKNGRTLGIVTVHDVVESVGDEERHPEMVDVRDIMSEVVVAMAESAPLGEAEALMLRQRVGHLLVLSDGEVAAGVVSLVDVLLRRLEDSESFEQGLMELVRQAMRQ